MAYRARFFWRRLGALLVDLIAVFFATTLLASLAQPFVSTKLTTPTLFHFSSCGQISDLKQSAGAVELLKMRDDEQAFAILCNAWNFGILKQKTLTVGAARKDGNVTRTRSFSFAVDEEYRQVHHFDLSGLIYFFVPLVFAVMLTLRSTTPGKSAFGLNLVSRSTHPADFRRYLTREYLRFCPLVLAGGFLLVSMVVTDPNDLPALAAKLEDTGAVWLTAGLTAAVLFVVALFYVVNMVRWRGRMFYDAISGFYVDVGQLSATPEE